MKIINKTIENINNDKNLKSKFISSYHKDLNLKCNILNGDFYTDSHNYFPITKDLFSFLDVFSWGDISKYKNFYLDNFSNNFSNNLDNFKNFSNILVLGSSSNDNYYRNMVTFLPRLFFIKDKDIKIAVHRNSSNRFKNFIKSLCNQMQIKLKFVFLDDNFYNFSNSQIPQFLNYTDNLRILNSLKLNEAIKSEKIYVSRQNCNYRNLVNEADIIEKLKPLGFKIIDLNGLEIIEQIKLFSRAKVIVSPSGSALTNIVFCNPGTKIIEISPKYNFRYEDIFKFRYQSISKILNLNYLRLEADVIDIKMFDKKIREKINLDVLNNSNYYKNLILKVEKINQLDLV